MSKDIYSNDHTIEVKGGTQTLNVSGNLSVTGVLTSGSGEEGELVFENLIVDNNISSNSLNVITANVTSLQLNNSTNLVKNVRMVDTLFNIQYGTSNTRFEMEVEDASVYLNSPPMLIPFFKSGSTSFVIIPITDYIPSSNEGFPLKNVELLMSGAGGVSAVVTVDLMTRPKTGGATSWTTIASEAFSVPGSNARSFYNIAFDNELSNQSFNALKITGDGSLTRLGLFGISLRFQSTLLGEYIKNM